MKLEGKIASVTGAGKGIGREAALAIAAEGATVVCVARTQANLDETVQMIEEKGGKATSLSRDLTDAAQVQSMVDAVVEQFGRIDILINNAVFKNARLSKQTSYESGAEVQIPYMLILLSALLITYDAREGCAKLVFIDEPFAKMDPGNVKLMLDFMKSHGLQMIFCAPDKVELIGNECEVVLPVLKVRADVMKVGSIKFHEFAV